MAEKTSIGTYRCTYCGKEFPNGEKANSCLDSHHLIYVPLTIEDLRRLLQFIFLKNEEILTPSLMRQLNRYNNLRGKDE